MEKSEITKHRNFLMQNTPKLDETVSSFLTEGGEKYAYVLVKIDEIHPSKDVYLQLHKTLDGRLEIKELSGAVMRTQHERHGMEVH